MQMLPMALAVLSMDSQADVARESGDPATSLHRAPMQFCRWKFQSRKSLSGSAIH